jgi:hypothetical protein
LIGFGNFLPLNRSRARRGGVGLGYLSAQFLLLSEAD